MDDADQIIRHLGMRPLPREGGFFVETYRSDETLAPGALPARYGSGRSLATSILYLLRAQDRSLLHRLASDEIWHFHLGDPAEMLLLAPDGVGRRIVLGPRIDNGQQVQVVVPRGTWQGARVLPPGRWALMGTTVAPGFDSADFEIADPGRLLECYPDCAEYIRHLI